MRGKFTPAQKKEMARRYVEDEQTLQAIGDAFGVSRAAVAWHLDRQGIARRRRGRTAALDENEIREVGRLCREENWTTRMVAVHYEVSQPTICKALATLRKGENSS